MCLLVLLITNILIAEDDSPGNAPAHRSWSWTDPLFLDEVKLDTAHGRSEKRADAESDWEFKMVVKVMMKTLKRAIA